MIHTMYVSNVEEPHPPVPFVPANSNVLGLIVIDNAAYAAVGSGCNRSPDALMTIDLETKKVAAFKPEGGVIAGPRGASFGPDGSLYIATTGGELFSLEPKTLKVKDTYKTGEAFASTPVVFEYEGKALIAVAAKNGGIHVLDTAALATPVAKSEPGVAVGTLETWQDLAGDRWLIGAGTGGLIAWKLADQGGVLSIQPGWRSQNLSSPSAPIIVNGVVFTASAGSTPALYGFDGASGKEIWHSGKIASAVRAGGLSAGNSQVYLGTDDGSLYVFGFPMER